MRRYFLGLLAVVALIILIIILAFHGNGSSKVANTAKTLSSYSTSDADVDLTIDGPETSDQTHQSLKITVTNSQVTFTSYQGYQGSVLQQKTYPNNVNAYSVFLRGLTGAGFTEGDNAADLQNSSGYCPLGDRYTVELNQGGQQIEKFWATNCNGTKTYKGNLSLTLQLFELQVPDYGTLSNNLNI